MEVYICSNPSLLFDNRVVEREPLRALTATVFNALQSTLPPGARIRFSSVKDEWTEGGRFNSDKFYKPHPFIAVEEPEEEAEKAYVSSICAKVGKILDDASEES